MLYHITLRHRPADCPGRNPQKARDLRLHFAERDARQQELGYQVRAFVGAWPSHTEYALVEAPDLAAVHRWTRTFPNHDEPTVCPVKRMADLITDSQNSFPVMSDTDSQETNVMQFHLTMEHNSQYCPVQNPDLIRALRERYEQREQWSTETGVRVQFFRLKRARPCCLCTAESQFSGKRAPMADEIPNRPGRHCHPCAANGKTALKRLVALRATEWAGPF